MYGDASPDIEACMLESGAVMHCLHKESIFIWGKNSGSGRQGAQAAMWW
jgi:hypothetical protein